MSILHVAFYPSDWLSGTRGMSDAETGVYITLIAKMYEMAGPIERDDNRLSRLCGCKSKSSFLKSLEYLIAEGKIVETKDGLFNERVEKEIKNTTDKSSKAREAAQSRWKKKYNKNNEGDNANASPKHMPERCQLELESDNTVPNGTDGDAVEIVWSKGRDWLVSKGVSFDKAGQMIGKWIRDSGSAEHVRAAMNEAKAARTGDPVPYITKILSKPSTQPDLDALLADVSFGGHG